MSKDHSPLPYQSVPVGYDEDQNITCMDVRAKNGSFVAEYLSPIDAEFIVKASNHHDELVAALERLLHEYEVENDDPAMRGDLDLDFNNWGEVIQARAILSKVQP